MSTHPGKARNLWALALLMVAAVPLASCDWLGITEAPTSSGVVALVAAPPSAPADGASVVLVTAEVDTLVSPAITEVKFATTLGTFTGSGATVAVDADGRARAQLRAPAETGTAIVTATAAGQTRSLEVSFTAAADGFTALEASPQAVPADGASTTLVTARVYLAAAPTVREVKFTTTVGAFTGGSASIAVPVDATGVARAQLRAPPDTASAIVTATAGSATRTAVVAFVPAPPTRLEVVAERFAVQAGLANSIAITATPLRAIGAPSSGTLVTFSADTIGGTGGSFGQFSTRSVLVRSGPATTRFSPGETSFRGRVVVRAVATMGGQSVSDSTVVTVTAP
jgi:hypothetical protein